MRHRTLLLASLCCAGLAAVAAPASAQTYLNWSGKPAESVTPPQMQSVAGDGVRRHPGVIPRQVAATAAPSASGFNPDFRQTRYSPTPANRLTPASAWTGGGYRQAEPAPAPYQAAPEAYDAVAPSPPPALPEPAYRRPAAAQVPVQVAAQVAAQPAYEPYYSPPPVYAPEPPRVAAPPPGAWVPTSAYADAPVPALQAPQPGFQQPAHEQSGAQPGYDPMAPRADAPIFRMGAAAPAPQGQASGQASAAYAAAEPPREGARYYSVHRAAGHQPDAAVMPASVYLDSAPIDLGPGGLGSGGLGSGASNDLAEPPDTPLPDRRMVNGRAQNIVPNEDPSLP